jgi:hypothetical protein
VAWTGEPCEAPQTLSLAARRVMFLADGLQQAPCLPALPPSRRVVYGLTGGFESRQKLSVDGLQALFDERRWIDDVGHWTIVLHAAVTRHPELPIGRVVP